jgi:hypothetical protein
MEQAIIEQERREHEEKMKEELAKVDPIITYLSLKAG